MVHTANSLREFYTVCRVEKSGKHTVTTDHSEYLQTIQHLWASNCYKAVRLYIATVVYRSLEPTTIAKPVPACVSYQYNKCMSFHADTVF